MVRARVWFRCAAMHDPVSPVLLEPCRIGWDAKERQVELTIERPLRGPELVRRMKGWVTVDGDQAVDIFGRHGRLKLLDDRELVVECEGRKQLEALEAELGAAFGDQVDLEVTKG